MVTLEKKTKLNKKAMKWHLTTKLQQWSYSNVCK